MVLIHVLWLVMVRLPSRRPCLGLNCGSIIPLNSSHSSGISHIPSTSTSHIELILPSHLVYAHVHLYRAPAIPTRMMSSRSAPAKSKSKATKATRPTPKAKPVTGTGTGKGKAKASSPSPSPSLSKGSSSSSTLSKPDAEPTLACAEHSSPEASQGSLGPTTPSQKMELVLRDIAKANAIRRTQKRKAVLDGYISAIEEVVKRRAGRWMEEGETREREWRRGVVERLREVVRRKEELEGRICRVLRVWEVEVGKVVGVVGDSVRAGCEGSGNEEGGEDDEKEVEEENGKDIEE
ncbi:hypothetical protein EV426DRAFT_414632 [Tirmania nivea]|nr:hypothetical protein EV426DRAFT_414632 [Tirmania nivea]